MKKFISAIAYAREKGYILSYNKYYNRFFVGINNDLQDNYLINDYR